MVCDVSYLDSTWPGRVLVDSIGEYTAGEVYSKMKSNQYFGTLALRSCSILSIFMK